MKYEISPCGVIDPNILHRYVRYLRLSKGHSPNTLDAYCKDLQKLLCYYSDEGIDFRTATLEQLDLFASHLRENGATARSAARTLSGVRSFYRFLLIEKEIQADPTVLLESPKIGKHLPQVLSVEEIERLLAAIDVSKPKGQRDRAIVETLYGCGLRISELCSLRISDLFLEEGYIRVHGKGSKERLVPIGQQAISEIRAWMARRMECKVAPGEEDYLFLSVTRGRRMNRISLFIKIRHYAELAGIDKTISPHTFRHSFATHLLQGGAHLRGIQMMLGHESIATTEIYMHLDRSHLRQAILEHHPRNIKYRREHGGEG